MTEIETVGTPEPECPTCQNDSHVVCEDCGNHWKMCYCIDSLMGCETCGTFFAWTPEANADRQQQALDAMLMELEEDEWEWEQPEPSQLKLGNTRGAGLKSNKGYPAPKKQKFLPSKGGGLYGQGDPMFVSGNKPLGKPCKHVMQPVEFKWGNESVTVYATAGRSNYDRKGNVPDFGLYLDSIWAKAPARNEFINWPDFKTPAKPELAAIQIVDAFIRACKGERVEVGCIGAHGRTGTVLACMGVLAGQQPEDAIDYIRSSYCHHAVETKDQELWVQWFHDYFFKEGSK